MSDRNDRQTTDRARCTCDRGACGADHHDCHAGACHCAVRHPFWRAMRRGWHLRCPICGAGPLLESYMKVRTNCAVCDAELHRHRADDGPTYVAVVVVGHVLAALVFVLFMIWDPSPLFAASVLSVIAVALSLVLLPRLTGAVVGIQWASRMRGHGRRDAIEHLAAPSDDGDRDA